jgi:archaellum component FlaC
MAVMMNPREKWTDERLDDLDGKVEKGFSDLKAEMKAGFDRMEDRFDKVDARFDKVDARFEKVDARFEKVDARFERMDERFERMDERFEKINDRFHTLNLALLGAAAVVIATLLGGAIF